MVDVVLLCSDSPVIQPKFVKGSKRYGRRSTPEFIEPFSASPDVDTANPTEEEEEEDGEDSDDSAVPRKREVRRVVHWREPPNTYIPSLSPPVFRTRSPPGSRLVILG